jgi:hypothetical protein
MPRVAINGTKVLPICPIVVSARFRKNSNITSTKFWTPEGIILTEDLTMIATMRMIAVATQEKAT